MADEEMMEVDTLLVDEDDGTQTEYAVLAKFDFEGNHYTVLSEVEGDAIGDEDVLFRYEEEDGDMVISSIDDDAEFERVSNYYASLED